MEPVSTFVLAVAMLASAPITRRPTWDYEPPVIDRLHVADGATVFLIPNDLSGEATAPLTSSLIAGGRSGIQGSVSPKEWLKLEVAEYMGVASAADGGVKPFVEAMNSALIFIDAIPSRLPLPRPMLSASGELGLYWDLPLGYAEASFESDGSVVFFSRNDDGVEHFQESLKVQSLNTDWFWNNLGELDEMQPQAA